MKNTENKNIKSDYNLQNSNYNLPDSNSHAFCIAGTSSGDGKTTVTLALMRALKNRGLKVQPFKCGPDYIDPTFHKKACKQNSINLDCWMMGINAVKDTFERHSYNSNISVVEGVMGLYDASRADSLAGSTAETAILLNLPVILVVDAKGMAGSIAAMVKGYAEFSKNINIVGVIANRVGSENHAKILQTALETAQLPPLLGFLQKNEKFVLPERHLGLVPFFENKKSEEWFNTLAEEAEKSFDIAQILKLSKSTHNKFLKTTEKENQEFLNSIISKSTTDIKGAKEQIKLGIAFDEAFHFYYPDNLKLLQDAGFEIIKFSPLFDKTVPDVDALYIGGGFPEMFAKQLEENVSMKESIKEFADSGKPIYAECGGFMYLTESIQNNSGTYKMCNIIPAKTFMTKKIRVLGYRIAVTHNKSFLGPAETTLRGHEFHWSDIEYNVYPSPAWEAKRATKNSNFIKTGYHQNNIFASYIHIHFASNPNVPKNWLANCKKINNS